jgi:midasin
VQPQELNDMDEIKLKLMHLHQNWQAIFLWQDGPLVQAMKNGDLFLIDEISLADDSVLERLNSVLEPERKLVRLLNFLLPTGTASFSYQSSNTWVEV